MSAKDTIAKLAEDARLAGLEDHMIQQAQPLAAGVLTGLAIAASCVRATRGTEHLALTIAIWTSCHFFEGGRDQALEDTIRMLRGMNSVRFKGESE